MWYPVVDCYHPPLLYIVWYRLRYACYGIRLYTTRPHTLRSLLGSKHNEDRTATSTPHQPDCYWLLLHILRLTPCPTISGTRLALSHLESWLLWPRVFNLLCMELECLFSWPRFCLLRYSDRIRVFTVNCSDLSSANSTSNGPRLHTPGWLFL